MHVILITFLVGDLLGERVYTREHLNLPSLKLTNQHAAKKGTD